MASTVVRCVVWIIHMIQVDVIVTFLSHQRLVFNILVGPMNLFLLFFLMNNIYLLLFKEMKDDNVFGKTRQKLFFGKVGDVVVGDEVVY
jgi:hypothetical protein